MKQTNNIKSAKYAKAVSGHKGRPAHYPMIEGIDGLLFYIQRNQNINTVIYSLNFLSRDVLNHYDPIKIEWIKFKENGDQDMMEINYIQRSLAYGYDHKVISNDLIEFNFVSYPSLKFFLIRNEDHTYIVKSRLEEQLVVIDHIYVFAEDLGVFPQVKFVEFYGHTNDDNKAFYYKLIIDQH
jgi:hypothetical protein